MQHLGRQNFFNDTPDFPTILKDLEIASYNFTKNPSRRTQEGIDEFKNSKHVISASRYILERSKKPEVHFHAVKALGEAVLKRWYLLQMEEIVDIRSYLINYVIGKTPSELTPLPDFVRLQAYKTIASIIKRGWLSSDLQETPTTETNNNEVINHILTLLISTDIPVREIGTYICTELVNEFSSLADATKMNLPWEFHRRAKQSFERTHLKTLFHFMVQTVKQIILVPEEHKIHVKRLFKLCSALMDTILSWPFNEDLVSVDTDTVTILDPGESWRDLLVRSTDVLQLYFEMYLLCRNDLELSHSVTQGLVQLASLQGKIFEDPQQQSVYLSNFSRGIFHIFYLPDPSAAVILNIGQMINRLVSSFPFPMFKTITQEQNFFYGNLTKMTGHVLHLAQKDVDTDSYMEAFDEILKAWVSLVKQFNELDPIAASFFNDCGHIFKNYAETRIILTSKGDIEKDSKDESEDYKLYSEQLASICQIGRAEINQSMHSLIQLLSDRYNFLHHQGAGGANIGDRLSETRWLVMIAGHLLIEEPKEGTLVIPDRIIGISLSTPQNQDPVIMLISLVFKFIDLENTFINSNQITAWSVNLAQTLIWFMNRWSMAYLYQSKQRLSPNLSNSFGCTEERGATVPIIEFFMKKIVINLMFYSNEMSIAEETCDLLYALTKRQIPAEHLLNITSWKELLRMHNMNDNRLNELPGRVHRKLLYALVSMNSLSPNGLQHFAEIVHPIRIILAQILQSNIQQHPQALRALILQIEKLRGIVRASQQLIAPFIWDFCVQFLDPILSLFPVLKENHEIIQLILGFWVDISRSMLNFLDDGKKEAFLAITFEKLFPEFQRCNFGKKRNKKRTTSLQDDQQQKKIIQILKVIYGISVIRHQRSARTSYFGIYVVIGALVPELLQFPKLSSIYYTVLQSLFNFHIDKLPLIPEELYPALLHTIESALTHPDYGNFALKCALDSLVNLLVYHFKIFATGNLDEKTTQFLSKSKNIINPFVPKMLEFLLSGDVFNNTITQSAGTAFFALLCFDKGSFTMYMEKLKEEQSPEVKEQVSKAFSSILSIEPNFNPQNCTHFILLFHNFLTVYRGLVKKK